MLRFSLMVLEKYGFQATNLCLLLFLSYKLCTNHLRHIGIAIKENGKKLEDIDKKLDSVAERVAKLEGQVE